MLLSGFPRSSQPEDEDEMNPAAIEDLATENPSSSAQNNIDQYLETSGEKVEHPMADRMILLYTKGRKTGISVEPPSSTSPTVKIS